MITPAENLRQLRSQERRRALMVLGAIVILGVVTPPAFHYWMRWLWLWIDGSVCQ